MNWWVTELLLSLVLVPLLPALVDLVPGIRAARTRGAIIPADGPVVEDFTVLVPVYGSIRYLENVDYLAAYGNRVTLCSTTRETDEFNLALHAIALENGFAIHLAECTGRTIVGRRQVAGTIRDQIIRDATESVTSEFVICLDADTTTTEPLGVLVGALVANDFDLASVRLAPANTGRLLGRLQAHEYRMSMRLRRVMPFLISGALQIGRASVHRQIMRRHSLYFQGNDAETGLLGDALGFKVGYLPFKVPTVVPDRFGPWWRQRLAWSGGEFRLFIVNFRLIRRHPFLVIYGAVIVIALWPVRAAVMWNPGLGLLSMLVLYALIVVALNWRSRDWSLLLYPVYGLFTNLILVPLGGFSYLHMARADRNYGLIRTREKVRADQVEVAGAVAPAPGQRDSRTQR